MYNPKLGYHMFGKETDETTGKRFYNTPDGPLASVTTILGATGNKDALNAWRERLGEAEANRQTNEASGLGTLVHEHLENYIIGEQRPGGSNLVRKMAADMSDVVIGRGLSFVDSVWRTEQELWYPGLYAGTADLIMEHKGAPCIGDFKTTKKPKKEEWVEDYKMQVVAYATAHNEVYGTSMRKGVIFMVSRTCDYQEFIVDGQDFDMYLDKWLARLDMFYSPM